MASFSINSEAGPSKPTFTLGNPISLVKKISDVQDHIEENDIDHTEDESFTCRPLRMTPPRPPRSLRRSFDSPNRRFSSSSLSRDTITHDWSPLNVRPSHRRASSTRTSSFSSIPPSPIEVIEEDRCRVSFDAIPTSPSKSTFSPITETEELAISRTNSRGSFGQNKDDQVTLVKRKSTKKKARFLESETQTEIGAEAPSGFPSRSNTGSSNKVNIDNCVPYISAFADEDNTDVYEDEGFRIPVDENIRSIPGIVGLGEGWAGGPQKQQKKKWYQRNSPSPQQIEEDPLSLWSQPDSQEGQDPISSSPSSSPLRGIWNRSKKNLFGQSATALVTTHVSPPRSQSRLKGLFSLSKVNLITSERNTTRIPASPPKGKSKRFSLGMISTSEITLQTPPSRNIPASPSMPVLASSIATTSTSETGLQNSYTQEGHASSQGDLTALGEAIPSRSSSLKANKGLPPPWRPSSMIVNPRASVLIVPDNEKHEGSASSTSIETPQNSDSGASSSWKGHTLTRSATFGCEDIASEQRMSEEIDLPGSDDSWVNIRKDTQNHGDGRFTPRSPTHHNRSIPSQSKNSWFNKIKNAFYPSSQQDGPSSSDSIGKKVDRLLVHRKSRNSKSLNMANNSDSANTYISGLSEPVMEPLKPSAPDMEVQRHSSKHRRRASWMIRSSSSLAKRLSRLTENEEDEHSNGEDVDRTRACTPIEPDQRGQSEIANFLNRRRSSNFSSMGFRSRRSSSVRSLEDIGRIPASLSMPALSRLTTTDLSLHVALEGEELGLDDILDQTKRESIISSLGFGYSTPNLFQTQTQAQMQTKQQALQSTFATLSGSSSDPASTSNEVTATNPSYKDKMIAKHHSLPLRTSYEKHQRNTTVSSIGSSISPSIMTPRHPNQMSTFLDALTLPINNVQHTSPPNSQSENPTLLGANLQMPKRNSVSTARFSMDSYITQPSLYDTEEVVHATAIRVDAIEDMQKKASVLSLEELGKNWPQIIKN
ncbi:uncharacterized protein IL334_000957 [Kwoniella shivajii]|uniref:AGC protein kinase n=1 Tax=Kwoniella shivajii TaxID=564305 RepID=A0ABZ1CQL9_9TREE|nr:hypothetical protein IL334_000957 [Kwoniella shivajii]